MKKLNKKKMALLTACICSALANGAYAAESADMDSYAGSEYVVTATRTPLEKKEVPQSVEVITKEEIEHIAATTVRDVLKTATNLVVVDGAGGHGDRLSLRGSDSNDILVLVNGRRFASENFYGNGSGNNRVLDRLNLSNVERIEIVRGPAGALYGSDAQAGVINIITKKSEKESFTIGFATGSREMSNYYHWDTGKQGKVSATVDASFGKLRNFDGKAGKGFVDGPTQNYTMDLDYEMDENNKLNFYLDYDKQNYTYGSSSSSFESRRDQERRTGAVTYSGKNDNSEYSASITYSQLDTDSLTSLGADSNTYKLWTFEARDSIKTADNNKFTFGGEYKVTEGSAYVEEGSDRINQYALYLQDEFKISDKLLLVPSVRYDHHNTFGSRTSPSMGATYFIADNSRFKATYGYAYRAPSVDELYGEFGHGYFTVYGNPDLKPEKSRGYELSYEHEFGQDTSSKLTYFNNKKEDAIHYEMITGTRNYRYYNINETESEGIEFEIKHDLGNGFTLIGAYDWLDARRNDLDEQLQYTARNTYTAKLMWTEPVKQEWSITAWNKWYTDYAYSVNSRTNLVDGKGSINTFNLAVNKRWGEKYRAYVAVDNLFNKDFVDMNFYGRLWRAGFEMTF